MREQMTQEDSMSITIMVRCAPWTGRPAARHRVAVEADGTVRVWDPVAHHYTVCHSLSRRTEARIVRVARGVA